MEAEAETEEEAAAIAELRKRLPRPTHERNRGVRKELAKRT